MRAKKAALRGGTGRSSQKQGEKVGKKNSTRRKVTRTGMLEKLKKSVPVSENREGERARTRQCVRCGLCLAACPLSGAWPPAGEVATPRGKVAMLQGFLAGELVPDTFFAAEFWQRCTLCRACETACPVGVPVAELVVGARRWLLEQGKVPATAAGALRSLRLYGNPWRRPPGERHAWAALLGLKDYARGARAETLLYLGCLAAYDPRAQRAARALAQLLLAAGVDFAVLGAAEVCCGREAYSLGEEGLFVWLAEKNLELWRRHGVRRVVTFSPHCYDAFKNLYPPWGEVWHYSDFLAPLVENGRLRFAPGPSRRVAYHDPCHLGRHNGVYEAPRALLRQLPGVTLVEVGAEYGPGVCCEAGGGRMWLPAPAGSRSPAHDLLRRAAALGAEVVAVACPFCLVSLDGAVQTGQGDLPAVTELAELLWGALAR